MKMTMKKRKKKKTKSPKKKKTKTSKKEGGPLLCRCATGCSSKRCACFGAANMCNPICKCKNCANPLSNLSKIGIDPDMVKEDACLRDNLSKLNEEYLNKTTTLPCCGRTPKVKDFIGGYTCGVEYDEHLVRETDNKDQVSVEDDDKGECGMQWKWSFCSDSACEEENRPRNHCEVCRKCGDYRDVHCDDCNKCYFSGLTGFNCPCQGGNEDDEFFF